MRCVILGLVQFVWILPGNDYSASSYARLHVPAACAALIGAGHRSQVYFQEADWSVDDLDLPAADVLVIVKVQPHGIHASRYSHSNLDTRLLAAATSARAGGCRVMVVQEQAAASDSYGELADAWVCAWPTPYMRQRTRELGIELYVTPDPFDSWVPSKLQRARVQGRLALVEGRARELVTIARRRHLQALELYRSCLPAPWTLTVISDEPAPGDALWSPEAAHEAVCRADALLVICSDEHSAPIRLLTGLRSGCPVLATPLASYIQEARPGTGWLPVQSPEDLSALLVELDEPMALVNMAASGAAWQRESPDVAANWMRILQA